MATNAEAEDIGFSVRVRSIAMGLLADSYEKRGWTHPAEEIRAGNMNPLREAAVDAIIAAIVAK